MFEFFARLWNRSRARPGDSRVFVPHVQAGTLVTEDTALTFSAVFAAARIISETVASLPWQMYRRMPTGREALPGHPVSWLLNTQPNPELTAYNFRRGLIRSYLLWGNGLAEIERGLDGRPLWLWPIVPDRVCPERDQTTGELYYVVRGDGADRYTIPRANMLHISDGSLDGLWGQSRIQLARRSVGAGIAADQFTAAYYGNGATIGGVIENKNNKGLSPEARELLLADFNDRYAGPDRAHKTMYLDSGMEYKPMSLPLSDAQFLETRRFSIEEVARWFGVPPHLLQELSNANYAISYESTKNFVEHTLRPLCVCMEQEANLRLVGARAQGAVYSRINLNGLLRGDPKSRAEYYKTMINAGVMSINEVRELEELNSIGADGDEHYLQTSMTTIARIARDAAEPTPPLPAPADQDEQPAPENVIRAGALAWRRENTGAN